MKKRMGWIDFLKGLAILAVIIDHLFNVIYYNQTAHYFTIFSVTLFVFLAGVTSVISLEKNNKPVKEYQLKRLKGILLPYVIATAIYGIVNHNYRFNWGSFWSDLTLFKASPPFYFILFFCQLILVAPYLYKLLSKLNVFSQILSLVPVYLISKYLTHFTEISGIYGGGGRILGGSYFFVFYLGMLFFLIYQRRHNEKVKSSIVHLSIILVSAILIYFAYSFGWLFKAWSNPPNKQAIFYSLSVFLFGYSVYEQFGKWKLTRGILSSFSIMGKYSLYIFIYHMLSIQYAHSILNALGPINNGLLKAILFLSFAIIIPVMIGFATKHRARILTFLSKIFAKESNQSKVSV